MHRASRALAAFAALLLAAAAGTLGAAPFFSRVGTGEGLPYASVNAIAHDGQGFVWLGTDGGLARYDGASLKLFSHDPFDAYSLPDNRVLAIFVDGDYLWVGTEGGLARLDLATERFAVYRSDPARIDALSDDVVACIARDSRGRLWVGTRAGLDILDEQTGRFKHFVHSDADPVSLPAGPVRALKADREGRLWVGCYGGGLAVYDDAPGNFRRYRNGLSNAVTALDLDGTGRLWVGSWGGGLSRFDPSTGRFEDHPTADSRVSAVFAGEAGRVYAGTWGGGLFEYDLAEGTFSRYRASSSPASLSGDMVAAMAGDGSGELWIGTNGRGVCTLSEAEGYDIISGGPDSFPPGKVSSVLVDRSGGLWVSVYNEGIARRAAGGSWRRYPLPTSAASGAMPGALQSPPKDGVGFLREDSRGVVWAGGEWGLARYDSEQDAFELVRPIDGAGRAYSGVASAMVDDPKGGAWVATYGSGLWRLSVGEARAENLEPYPPAASARAGAAGDLLRALSLDSRGRLWAGGNGGLKRLDDGGWVGYRPGQSAAGVAAANALFFDSRGVLWVGTAGGGLARYEPETDSFVSYTTRDGLPSDSVVRILEDASGLLWLATTAGIAVYDRSSGSIRQVHLYDAERDARIFSASYGGSDGSLYFGALDRLYRVDPRRFTFNVRLPPLAFSSIIVPGSPAIESLAASRLRRLDLSWRRNSVTFEFAALDYRDPERNHYSYKLEGFDSTWTPAGGGHAASYAKLPGGNYTFRVKASNGDGLWNEEGLNLPVKVSYSPWASPWTLLALALLLAGGGYASAYLAARSSLREARLESDSLIAKLIDASASIENASIVDSLTGLPSKRKAEEHLELAFARAARLRLDLALVMVDIDHFKSYNDSFGKAAGDECLRAAAKALSGIVRRSSDFLARYGGEEFIFVLEETSLEGALATGEAARRAVEGMGGAAGAAVTASVGCASMQPEAGLAPAYLVAAAAQALMAAKQKGRNRASV